MITDELVDDARLHLELVGFDVTDEHAPSVFSITTTLRGSFGRVLVTYDFNHDGWEAAFESYDGERQTPLLDGPNEHGSALEVAAWVARLVRHTSSNLA